MEINFLELLLKNRSKIVTYTQIEYELYNDKEMNKNMPKMFARNLRKKIPNIPLKSKVNVGYILEC
jgi:DNA-binding response OmpR family regulator